MDLTLRWTSQIVTTPTLIWRKESDELTGLGVADSVRISPLLPPRTDPTYTERPDATKTMDIPTKPQKRTCITLIWESCRSCSRHG